MSDRWLYGWALGYAAVGAASLLVPLYVLALDGSALVVGLVAASAALAGVPGALLWGRLAARTQRRRPFLLVALGATALALVALPALQSPWLVLAANAVLWFVVAAAAPVLNIIVVAGVPESEWEARIGRLQALQSYGWLVGLVGGLLWTLAAPRLGLQQLPAQRLLFLALAATAALALAVVRVWYPEQADVTTRRFAQVYRRLGAAGGNAGRLLRTVPYGPTRGYWALRTLRPGKLRDALDRPLRRYLLAVTLFSAGFAVFWGPMPAFLRGRGFADGTVFALFLAGTLGSALAYDQVGALCRRAGTANAETGALAARVVLFPLVGVLGGVVAAPVIGALFAAIGVTWAVIGVTGTGLTSRLVDGPERAEALGLYTALVGLGTGLGSAAGGALAGVLGYRTTFGLAGGVVLAGLLLAVASGRGALAAGPTGTETGD
jgi:MFS family permease